MNSDRGLIGKIVCPLTYALIFPVTLYFTYAVFYHAPTTVLESDILFFGASPVVFSGVYVVFGTLLLLLERLTIPSFVDHLRRSSLVYAGFLISVSILFLRPLSSSDGEDYWLFAMLGAMFLCVIIVDFSILLVARLRSLILTYRATRRTT